MKPIREKNVFAPAYHLYSGTGWINDPCGCTRFRGEYHVFYQRQHKASPIGPGNWFHMKSPDLIQWEDLGMCLQGEHDHESGGCWTGSSLELDGQHVIYYSANKDGRIPQQQPCRAVSTDGVHYLKQPCHPLITEVTPDGHAEMRDPKVFCRNGFLYMLEGSRRDGNGEIIGYRSRDGLEWEYCGIFFRSDSYMGDMFECPDFFSMDGKDFLLFSPMNWERHANVILCGKADFEAFRFVCESVTDLDLGSDFYAAQSIPLTQGRMGVIGWLGSWGKQHPETQYGWAGMLTWPREVRNHAQSGAVTFAPAREISALRKTEHSIRHRFGDDVKCVELESDMHEEIILAYPEHSGDLIFSVEILEKEHVLLKITLDHAGRQLVIEKDDLLAAEQSLRTQDCNLLACDEMRLLLDGSCVEVYFGSGEVVSERIYPSTGQTRVRFAHAAGKCCGRIMAVPMESIYEWR